MSSIVEDQKRCVHPVARSGKAAILAYAVAQTLRPQLADEGDGDPTFEKAGTLMAIHCGRSWRPDTAFFERLTCERLGANESFVTVLEVEADGIEQVE